MLHFLFKIIVDKIVNIYVDSIDDSTYKYIWRSTNDDNFSVKSIYMLDLGTQVAMELYLKVACIFLFKCSLFFVFVLLYKLLTNAQRGRRGLATDPSCGICDDDFESIISLDCSFAAKVWRSFPVPDQCLLMHALLIASKIISLPKC